METAGEDFLEALGKADFPGAASGTAREGQMFVLEFRMEEDGTAAQPVLDRSIARIRERRHAGKYRGHGKPVHRTGMVFDGADRNLPGIRAEML